MRGRSKHAYDSEELKVLNAVWEPWTQLHPQQRAEFNNRGMNGEKIRTHNVNQLPYKMPWVIRKNDPRIEILRNYYPDIYQRWLSIENPEWRRIETAADTDENVRERIKKYLQRSQSRSKIGLPPEEIGPSTKPEGTEKAKAAVLKTRINALRAKDENDETGLPDDIVKDLLSDIDKGDLENVERWLSVFNAADEPDEVDRLIDKFRHLEEATKVDYYRYLLRTNHWHDKEPIMLNIQEQYEKYRIKI